MYKCTNGISLVFILFVPIFIFYTLTYNMQRDTHYSIDYILNPYKGKIREPIYVSNGSEDFLIDTKGCYIPNYSKKFKFNEPKIVKKSCGDRAVFITRTENDKELVFRIDSQVMNKYVQNRVAKCYYNFGRRLNGTGPAESRKMSYTKWQPFENGTSFTLVEEIIKVKCDVTSSGKPSTVYEDAYVFIKKLESKPRTRAKMWNVLVVGMDTMSRGRLRSSMPKTAKYFSDFGWLDYKGYNKVGYNTFPNIMAFLTGKKMKTIYSKCSHSLYDCNGLFIWSMFRKNDYKTAYAEDNLNLPDTFSRYNGFRINPTHHYIRPFFFTGESSIGNLVCAHHKPSALHLLDYAHDFTKVYKQDNFFGVFWINSYSHNLQNNPQLIDSHMVHFFQQLKDNGTLNNTIVLFLSDHGIRFGHMREPIESFYEERLPMLYVWIPHDFRKRYEYKYYSLQLNQNRLVTPYDIYLTMAEISQDFKYPVKSEACSQCSSLFIEKSSSRMCADAGISEKWCTCHGIYEVDINDSAANGSLYAAVKHIQDFAKTIETKTAAGCHRTYLKKVLRVHSYVNSSNKTHYVVAWLNTPGGMAYEATVARDGNKYTVLEPTYSISSYASKRGDCVKHSNDREFCVCK